MSTSMHATRVSSSLVLVHCHGRIMSIECSTAHGRCKPTNPIRESLESFEMENNVNQLSTSRSRFTGCVSGGWGFPCRLTNIFIVAGYSAAKNYYWQTLAAEHTGKLEMRIPSVSALSMFQA